MLELAVELGNSNLVQLLLDAGATLNLAAGVVPPLMIAVLHRHRGNVQSLLNARVDPWQAVPVVSLCDHPWYCIGSDSCHDANQSMSCKYPLPGPSGYGGGSTPPSRDATVIEQQKGPCTHSPILLL